MTTALAVGGLTVERSVRRLGEYAALGIPLAVVAEPYGVEWVAGIESLLAEIRLLCMLAGFQAGARKSPRES